MGYVHRLGGVGLGTVFTLLGVTVPGCQMHSGITTARLVQHQQVMNTTGLQDVATFDAVKARAAAPQKWDRLKEKKTALYTDVQWRSPSHLTGVGIVYVRMPLPFPASTLLWFAKQEYCKRSEDGKLIGQWTDSLGRPWFEAENKRYHVRGFVITKGFEAWIVYSGYRTENPPVADEIAVAKRAQESIMPTPVAPTDAQTPTATAD
jgi:hypothetical protein